MTTASQPRRRKKRKKPQPMSHRCTLAKRRFLLALQETSAAGKCLTQRELAEIAGVSESQVSRWNCEPGWREAVAAAMRDGLKRLAWLRAEIASAGRAARGNLLDWRLYLENGGPTSWREPISVNNGDMQTPAAGAIGAIAGVQVHIHGIPEPAPRTTLPPPLELPAPAGAASSGPGTSDNKSAKATTNQPAMNAGR